MFLAERFIIQPSKSIVIPKKVGEVFGLLAASNYNPSDGSADVTGAKAPVIAEVTVTGEVEAVVEAATDTVTVTVADVVVVKPFASTTVKVTV